MARRSPAPARKTKAPARKRRYISTVRPAVGMDLPLAPGKEMEVRFDWEVEEGALTDAWNASLEHRTVGGEVLLVPNKRWDEALELKGWEDEPLILASRCRILNWKNPEEGGVTVRLRGLETVGLKACRAKIPYMKFSFFEVAQPEVAPGINGDGVSTVSEVPANSDARLEADLRMLPLSAEGKRSVERELELMHKSTSDQAQWSRTYLETILELPWVDTPLGDISLAEAAQILDQSHAGMEAVKERVLDFLAALAWWNERKEEGRGRPRTSLLLVGPPGVGKTTIAQAIAAALHVSCEIVALGGMTQEGALMGLDRGYRGAMTGAILNAILRAKSRNPVIVLDEIDKTGSEGVMGALLNVLDPSQNKGFRDRFLNLPIDLSGVVFIATANSTDKVHDALLDRMEVITLNGYSRQEKVSMMDSHLIRKEREIHRVRDSEIPISPEIVSLLVKDYTDWDPGARGLSKGLGRLYKRAVRNLKEGKDPIINEELVRKTLGPPLTFRGNYTKPMVVGTVWGMVVMNGCGGLLMCEAALIPGGKGALVLTGEQGKVLKESATTILSLARINGDRWGGETGKLRSHDVHLNMAWDEGVDGPSAGCALLTALMSALLRRPVRPKLAMTGKVSLSGQILPIGGLREKLLGAAAAGMETVLIPARNLPDLQVIPADVYAGMEVLPVDQVDELMALALLGENEAGGLGASAV